MSDMEHHVGKLRKITINPGHTVEDWAREKCQSNGFHEKAPYNWTWWDQLWDHYPNKYFKANEEVWEAIEHRELDASDDIYELTPNEDGTVSFVMRFYNGGTCFSESIEEGLKKLKD